MDRANPRTTAVAEPRSAGQIRVLVVDDEPNVTAALEMGLRAQRFAIHTENSADAALGFLESNEVDVVVSDERMPGMNGCTFLSQVRQRWPETMRVMLTGHADSRAMLDAINEAQVYRFLTKPCSAEDVAFCVRHAAAAKAQRMAAHPVAVPVTSPSAEEEVALFRRFVDRLWMAYQPVVSARDGSLVAHEALVRSDDPEFKSADKFVRMAERHDAVELLDRAIRERVAADLDAQIVPRQVLVNLHPRSLLDESLYAADGPFAHHRERVILEITERENLSAIGDLSARVRRLRDLGHRVAIDDLGSGYSGLSTFTAIVPDIVKFDLELIRDIDHSAAKSKLVRSMTTLCRDMGITTIAEGIETPAERRCAIDLGCDLLQGYLLGRPARLVG